MSRAPFHFRLESCLMSFCACQVCECVGGGVDRGGHVGDGAKGLRGHLDKFLLPSTYAYLYLYFVDFFTLF